MQTTSLEHFELRKKGGLCEIGELWEKGGYTILSEFD